MTNDVVTESESLGYQLFKQFISLQRGSIDQYYRDGAKRLGLRLGEFTTLLQIYLSECDGEPATVSSLAEINHCTKSNISQITKILENNHYIVRKPSEKDHRTMHLTLTENARGLVAQNDLIGHEAFVRSVAQFGTDRSKNLLALLQEFIAIYNSYIEEGDA